METAAIVDQLLRALQPKRILEVGGDAMAAELRQRGKEASSVQSLAEVDGAYDLILCHGPVDELPPGQLAGALDRLSGASDTVLFGMGPGSQPVVYWLREFEKRGFAPVYPFDASFFTPLAILLRRGEAQDAGSLELFAELTRLRGEVVRLREAHESLLLEALHSGQDRLHEGLQSVSRALGLPADTALGKSATALENSSATELAARLERLERQPAGAVDAILIRRLENRLSGAEKRLDEVHRDLTGMLNSRIWRTLMSGGGFVLRILGR